MIDPGYRRPGQHLVAAFAAVGTGDMACGFSGRRSAVVAADTVTADPRMIKIGRCPGGTRMTIVTGI